MMLELNESNFKDALAEHVKLLVFFYRESGCSFCDKMKPLVEEYAKENVVGMYKLGQSPDSVNAQFPVERFPTFYAFIEGQAVGKQEGAVPYEHLELTFTPEKLPPKQVPIEKASSLQLMTDEANLIDQLAPLRGHLAKIQKEIARRKKLASSGMSCCDSCAEGGECEGGCH